MSNVRFPFWVLLLVGFPSPAPAQTGSLASALNGHVKVLSIDIGERHGNRPAALARAARYVETQWQSMGYSVERQPFLHAGQTYENLVIERQGTARPTEVVVIGAHYDTAPNTPGANDNGSGVAALIELARLFAARPSARTLRFVAFTNEEPPHFHTASMGSLVYARRCKAKGENIVGMLSLETMGYYVDQADSQQYPFPLSLFYPSKGNFVAFVGDLNSRGLVKRVKRVFERTVGFPTESASLPGAIEGVGWSDHWSFWQVGYPALMVTDTAPFRYGHYHRPTDTPDKLDYVRFARVVRGLRGVIMDLVDGG